MTPTIINVMDIKNRLYRMFKRTTKVSNQQFFKMSSHIQHKAHSESAAQRFTEASPLTSLCKITGYSAFPLMQLKMFKLTGSYLKLMNDPVLMRVLASLLTQRVSSCRCKVSRRDEPALVTWTLHYRLSPRHTTATAHNTHTVRLLSLHDLFLLAIVLPISI